MVELWLIACLMTQPQRCEEVYVPFQEPATMAVCLRQGQVRALEWIRGHPGWRVRRWTCAMTAA